MSAPTIAEAEARSAAAKARLSVTMGELQVRLDPKTIARNTAHSVADASTAAAQASVDVAKRNPGAVAGFAAVAGLFLARHRIAALFKR